ncbi:twin-arginine translocase TatA/TatE family subunit [Cellvibrio japonicus]|nr:twin-arginine translocase TatA/TatE family subunit [Cellvibrio japonicus]QEI11183.1 twin-arginine translocase TatA/TatE family subunit [Cellvibrio japonicus]QEI14757.1 twin-arginine translocase TatA/TatE family subunit [Cellvibrio japonicus]QEI18337.1 twin-arginine translocase TatA/TatE family subunit [Cellvibrio japonicus]
MALSFWQVLLVVVLFLLLFGRGKIPQLMGDLAEGIRSFRKGVSDVSDTPNTANAEQKTERVDEQKQA